MYVSRALVPLLHPLTNKDPQAGSSCRIPFRPFSHSTGSDHRVGKYLPHPLGVSSGMTPENKPPDDIATLRDLGL